MPDANLPGFWSSLFALIDELIRIENEQCNAEQQRQGERLGMPRPRGPEGRKL